MHQLAFELPMLDNTLLAFEILTSNRWSESINDAKLGEVLGNVDGENLTIYLADNGICYGQLNLFEFDESAPDWDEGFEDERQLSPVNRFGYAFKSIEDARSFWQHIRVTWLDESTPYGFVRLNPSERNQLLQGQAAIEITEQYDIEGWESLRLSDGRILLTNPHRADKAHASLFNNLTDYLIDKQANEDFLDYINQQTD
jgi:hypothetical protein